MNREISANLAKLERTTGRRFGDPKNPLLLSVRSGAQFSMPGMMDTILDLGMNDRIAAGLAAKSGDPRFAYDCYRRFLSIVRDHRPGRARRALRPLLEEKRQERSAPSDAALDAEDLSDLCRKFKLLVKERTRKEYRSFRRSSSRWRATRCSGRGTTTGRSTTGRRRGSRRHRHRRHRAGDGFRQRGERFGHGGVVHPEPLHRGEGVLRGVLVNAQGADVVAGARTRARCAT